MAKVLPTYARNVPGLTIGPHGIISTFADGKLTQRQRQPISFYDEVFKYDAPLEASEDLREDSYGSLS